MIEFKTSSPEETRAWGQKLAGMVKKGMVLCLEGDLGAGKTLFVQGIAKGLGIEDEVTSPTFSLMNLYRGAFEVRHFDLYRLDAADQLEDIGFYEYAQPDEALVIIEWPDKFREDLPDAHIWIRIERGSAEEERTFSVYFQGTRDREFYEELKASCQF